jgi:hypothetical protein
MKSSLSASLHFLANLALTIVITSATVALGQAAEDGKTPKQNSGGNDTVTHDERPAPGDDWTPARMREAKPFPMPSRKGPPVPQQVTPNPYAEPSGGLSPGSSGPAPR